MPKIAVEVERLLNKTLSRSCWHQQWKSSGKTTKEEQSPLLNVGACFPQHLQTKQQLKKRKKSDKTANFIHSPKTLKTDKNLSIFFTKTFRIQ